MERLIDANTIPYREYLGDDEPRVYRSQIEAMPTIDPVQQDSALMVEKLEVGNGSIDMSLSGEPAKLFMAGIVNLFKHSGAENFLTLTVSDRNEDYAITIQGCKRGTTPAQKLAELKARAEKAEAERDQLRATIDPVKHGQWIDRDTIDDDGNKDVECSECWHGDKQRPGISVPYCWFCGAKMDGAVVADQNTAKTAALDGQIGKEPCDCNAFWGGPDCGMDGDAHE